MATLAARGVRFVEPGAGYLACGWIGKGRLAEPEMIADGGGPAAAPERLAPRQDWSSSPPAPPTKTSTKSATSAIDRAAAWAMPSRPRRRGAARASCSSPVRRRLDPPHGAEVVRVRSAAQMRDAVQRVAADADVVVMAAAVADYTPADGAIAGKIEKGQDRSGLELTLVPTPDILAELGRRRGAAPRPVLIGFAAQSGDPVARGRDKLRRKAVDMIVANDISRPDAGFDVETNAATLITRRRRRSVSARAEDRARGRDPRSRGAACFKRAIARTEPTPTRACHPCSVVRLLRLVDRRHLAEHLDSFRSSASPA